MKYFITLIMIIGASVSTLFAQESKLDTIKELRNPFSIIPPSIDTSLFKLSVSYEISLPKDEALISPEKILSSYKPFDTSLLYKKPPRIRKPVLPFELTPDLNFNIVPSRWNVPILGETTTFSPMFSYQPFDKMTLYGGVGFTQYHNLAYVQHMIAPNWPTGSNITAQAFGGLAYKLHDRITLHGSFQHSLYNQMPSNLIMFAPAYNIMTIGADVDIWNGLGVRVEQVWEFDRYGRMHKGMRYSPIINLDKFMKFLGY